MMYCPGMPVEPKAPTVQQEIANELLARRAELEDMIRRRQDELEEIDAELMEMGYMA